MKEWRKKIIYLLFLIPWGCMVFAGGLLYLVDNFYSKDFTYNADNEVVYDKVERSPSWSDSPWPEEMRTILSSSREDLSDVNYLNEDIFEKPLVTKSETKDLNIDIKGVGVAPIFVENNIPAASNDILVKITAKSVMDQANLSDFEWVHAHNINNRPISENGMITYSFTPNGKMSVVGGTVVSDGFLHTNADILVGDYVGNIDIEVPVVDSKWISKWDGLGGGYLLLDVDSIVEDITINTDFLGKHYLDEDFSERDHGRYLLFTGVSPSNIMLTIKLLNGDMSYKIVQVLEGEMTFAPIVIENSNHRQVVLKQRNLLGLKMGNLSAEEEYINYFNSNQEIRNIGPSLFEYNTPMLPLGTREYLELYFDENPVFVGNFKKEELIIPSNKFIKYMSGEFGLHEESCVIQINLEKSSKNVEYGYTFAPIQNQLQPYFLGRDGDFKDNTEDVDTIFLVGQNFGKVDLKVEYFDSTVDFLQSFCSQGSYIVEQL